MVEQKLDPGRPHTLWPAPGLAENDNKCGQPTSRCLLTSRPTFLQGRRHLRFLNKKTPNSFARRLQLFSIFSLTLKIQLNFNFYQLIANPAIQPLDQALADTTQGWRRAAARRQGSATTLSHLCLSHLGPGFALCAGSAHAGQP